MFRLWNLIFQVQLSRAKFHNDHLKNSKFQDFQNFFHPMLHFDWFLSKNFGFWQNTIFWKNFDFWEYFGFLTKNLVFDKISFFSKNLDFWLKNSIINKKLDFWKKMDFGQKCRSLTKIWNFEKKNFRQEIRLFRKLSILTEIPIFSQNFY